MNKYTEIIEKYLKGEMTASEQSDFEKQLESNSDLKRELENQQLILKGIERAGIRAEINRGFKKGSFKTKAGKWMLGLAITAIAVATVMVVKTKVMDKPAAIRYDLNEENSKNWSEADKNILPQIFKIKGDQDTVIETKDGIVLHIPARAFLNSTGDEVTDDYELEIKEAMTPLEIMKAGLSTTSDGKLLETGGMFYINARKDGKNLIIPANKIIHANIPDHTSGKKMMLFDGKRMSDGNINWVNPKPMESKLTTLDIRSLNFYPPHFLDSLKVMGFNIKNKKLTDSIYYSFVCGGDGELAYHDYPSEDGSITKRVVSISAEERKRMQERSQEMMDSLTSAIAAEIKSGLSSRNAKSDSSVRPDGEKLFKENCAVCHAAHTDQKLTGPGLKGVVNRVPGGDWLRRYILNSEKMIKSGDAYANKVYIENGKAAMTVFEGQLSDADVSAIINYLGGSGVEHVHNSGSSPCEIAPSRIRAIWDKKFNHTLLATKEFEARLQVIFKTCNHSLLDLYIKNMDKKMYEIDSLAALMAGEASGAFWDFYNKRQGGVSINSKELEKLNTYMQEKRSLYENTAIQTLEELYKKEGIDNQKAMQEKNAHNLAESQRINTVFAEELETNMKEAYRQLDKPYVKAPAPAYFEGVIQTTGWKNVDAYVMESTLNRKTLDYTDPENGKKAVIRYEAFAVNVKNSENYDRVLAYLIPDSLSSFQRMKGDKQVFKEKLNELFTYSGFVLGFRGETMYGKSITVKPGEISVELSKLSEKDLQKFSTIRGASHDLITEFNYQAMEQKDDLRRKKITKREEIRGRLMPVIFPCAVAPQQAAENEFDNLN